MILNALLSIYEHHGYKLYENLDYQTCKTLIEISASNKKDPEILLQEQENATFNKFLNKVAYNRFRWAHLDKKHNLFNIKKISPSLLTPITST